MLRVGSLMRLAAFAAVILLVVAETSEAQRKKQGRQGRQRNRQGGGRFGGGRFGGGGSIAILKNKYLQEELKFTAAQKKRINEIDIQLSGNRALQREDVQKALGITETQKTKLADANKASDEKRRELFRGLFGRGGGGGNAKRPNREELTKKFAELRTSGDKAIFAVLTTSQKAKFEKMKGKPIDRTKLFQRRTPQRKRPEL